MTKSHVYLFKDANVESYIKEHETYFAIKEKTCIYVHLYIPQLNFEKLVANDCKTDTFLNAWAEMIKDVGKRKLITDDNKNRWFGTIYFKGEESKVFPRMFIDTVISDSIQKSLPNPIFYVEGNIILRDISKGNIKTLRSERFQKSSNFEKKILALPLSPPLPMELCKPIEERKFVVESFSLSIGWDDVNSVERHIPELALANIKLHSEKFLMDLLEGDNSKKDFTIVAENGIEIHCHGLIISARCPALAAMTSPDNAMKEGELKRIEMKTFSEEALNFFVKFLYCQSMNLCVLKCDVALELFQLGHMYQLPELPRYMGTLMRQKDEKWFTPDCILELYFFVRNLPEFEELSKHAEGVILKLSDQVRKCERYKELDSKDVADLLWLLLDKLKAS